MRFTTRNAFSDSLAIDLGTANTLVYAAGRGILIDEPTLVAMRNGPAGREVWAVGAAAARLLGRTPEALLPVWPLADGVIGDFVAAEELLRQFIRRCRSRFAIRSPHLLLSVPPGATAVERRAVEDAAEDAGARRVYLIAEPVAAALGAGLPVDDSIPSMIIDIGGGTTDLAVLASGRVVATRTIRSAGHAMDEAIVRMLRRKYGIAIDRVGAERIKLGLPTSLSIEFQQTAIDIEGLEPQSDRLMRIAVPASDIAKVIQRRTGELAEHIETFFDELPAETVQALRRRRVCVTGGGALLPDLDRHLARRLGMPVFVASDPLRSVIKGSAVVLTNLETRAGLLLPG